MLTEGKERNAVSKIDAWRIFSAYVLTCFACNVWQTASTVGCVSQNPGLVYLFKQGSVLVYLHVERVLLWTRGCPWEEGEPELKPPSWEERSNVSYNRFCWQMVKEKKSLFKYFLQKIGKLKIIGLFWKIIMFRMNHFYNIISIFGIQHSVWAVKQRSRVVLH